MSRRAQGQEAAERAAARRKGLGQLLGFLAVGAFNAGVSYVTYCIVVGLGGHYLAGSLTGYAVSVFSAWLFQYFLIFREGGVDSPTPWWQTLLKTYLSYAFTGLFLNNVLLVLMLDVCHIEVLFDPLFAMGELFVFGSARDLAEYLAPLAVMVISMPVNFILNKFWAYRKRDAA